MCAVYGEAAMLGSLLMVEACSDTDRALGELDSEALDPPDLFLGIFGLRFRV